MIHKGLFGYIIGKKKRFMHVDSDADLLWRILVREIYVLMKHFDSKECLQKAFEKIKVVKDIKLLKPVIIEKCKIFTDNEEPNNYLKFCQSSFINLLEAGHILINKDNEQDGFCFVLDFNKWDVNFYWKTEIIESASIEEIMNFKEMPTKSYNEIILEMKDSFNIYYDKVTKNEDELEKLNKLLNDVRNHSAVNIENKLDKLMDDMKWKLKKLHMERRVFYYRLKALNLIEQ